LASFAALGGVTGFFLVLVIIARLGLLAIVSG
jgi:hypothetical protein